MLPLAGATVPANPVPNTAMGDRDMPRRAGTSPKAKRDQLRDRMRALGCTVPQIAAEMALLFSLRPRAAWRHALDWPQWKVAQRYNTIHCGTNLSDNRISEFENWPHGGNPPTLRYRVRLAATFGHGCTPTQLVDTDDLEHLTSKTASCSPSPRASTHLRPSGSGVELPDVHHAP